MRRYVLVVLGMLLASENFAQTWTKLADIPDANGKGRWGAFCFSANSSLYVGGGYVGSSVNRNDLWEYDPAHDHWTKRMDIPGSTNRTHAVAFAINGKGYVGLGQQNFQASSYAFLKGLWEYDPITDHWTQMADLPDTARCESACFVINNKAYIIGGRTNYGLTDEVWEYDPASNHWTMKHNYPLKLDLAQAFAIGDTGYVTGGRENIYTVPDTYEYDAISDNWISKADYCMDGRHGGVGFALNGVGYVGLGNSKTTTVNSTYKEFCKYNSGIWSPAPDYADTDRVYAVAGTLDGKAYVGGGFIYISSENYFSDWYVFDPSPLNVPGVAKTSEFSIYPQPANTILKISIANQNINPLAFTITDMTGRNVGTGNLPPSGDIDISNLVTGTYFLKIGNNIVKFFVLK